MPVWTHRCCQHEKNAARGVTAGLGQARRAASLTYLMGGPYVDQTPGRPTSMRGGWGLQPDKASSALASRRSFHADAPCGGVFAEEKTSE
jgi:hypothetical protein